MAVKTVEYKVRFNDDRMLKAIVDHLIRWILLTVVTLGLALIVYPFYLFRFVADRVSIVRIFHEVDSGAQYAGKMEFGEAGQWKKSSPTERFLSKEPAPDPDTVENIESSHKARVEDAQRRHYAHLADMEQEFDEARKRQSETEITAENVRAARDTLAEQYDPAEAQAGLERDLAAIGKTPADLEQDMLTLEKEVTSPPPVHVRLFHFADPQHQGEATWGMPVGDGVFQPLDGYLDAEMKDGYVPTVFRFVPDSKDLMIVTEYDPIRANYRVAFRLKAIKVKDGEIVNDTD